ncbi:hypothetical protein MACK_003646 [Theileria orientalis]|uniref:Uncharacterized protein n=1 Tax=Theileria orientalis TaxID=68886 RepID=A0A976XJL4_THEOR|nr:hypothetical protein MACK_003646 [Theileria orientalis]
MLITKCLLLVLFLYGKNTVKTTDKSVVPSPGFVACDDSECKTGGSDSGLSFGNEVNGDDDGLTASGDNEGDGSTGNDGSTSGTANGANGTSSGLASPTGKLKLYKDDPDGNKVEIKTTECYEDQYLGNFTYAFKKDVKCTLVKFGDKDVWKKGDKQVDEPRSVTYDSVLGEVTVRDADNSVHFGKETDTGKWKHVVTIPRTKMAMVDKRAETVPKSHYAASTDTPESHEASEEAEEGSTVASPEAGSDNEVGTDAGLRGTPAPTEASEEADKGSIVASPEDGGTNESSAVPAEGASSGDASTDADGSSASASGDASWTAGPGAGSTTGDGSVQPAEQDESSKDAKEGDSTTPEDKDGSSTQPESEDSTQTGSGNGSGQSADAGSSGEAGEAKSPDGQSTKEASELTDPGSTAGEGEDAKSGGWTSGSVQGGSASPPPADGGSGTDTSGGEGTQTADGSADKGAGEDTETGGEGEDGSSQPSSGAPTSGGTDLTGGGDGSLATPPGSPASDGTSATPGQDGTATSPTAGVTEPETKTGVELSLKATAGTNEFDYNKDGNTVTYTAKDGFGFSSVKTKTGGSSCGSSCGGSDVTIWDAKDASEYAGKVVLNGKGQKEKIVTIHMPDGTTKSYKKDGKNKPWREYSGPLPSTGQSDGTQRIELLKADPNDSNKTIEIATSEYNVKSIGDDHLYRFNDGVNCILLKIDGKEVWKHDSSKHSGKYPKVMNVKKKYPIPNLAMGGVCKGQEHVNITCESGSQPAVYKAGT